MAGAKMRGGGGGEKIHSPWAWRPARRHRHAHRRGVNHSNYLSLDPPPTHTCTHTHTHTHTRVWVQVLHRSHQSPVRCRVLLVWLGHYGTYLHDQGMLALQI
ncbi:hypothetical protein ANANG_G00025700 [Anguilla anguilla]|uniref:Uncharacterized protein n=1 Tax=Anguilla anguilla TaxID=7936 RepID=A0A9D3N026_ANGAN|nr:hypothetical protein ANANG_G00025700 [Anguilla anguilla]